VTRLPPGAHGGDGHRLAELLGVDPPEILDLSLSLNPVAPDPVPFVARHVDAVRRYPPVRAERARSALGDALGVEPARLVLTNGGAEAIALVASMHPSGWAEEREFSLYRRHLRRLRPDGPRWMSDPHNPTGRLAAAGERALVRDEAFYPLATGRWSRHDPDTIVIGSLTKVFACPGLRLGYVIAPDERTAVCLEDLRAEWSVNALAVAVLPDLVAVADIERWAAEIAVLRAELRSLLAEFGYAAAPGAANYLWVEHAPGLRDRLLPHGILLRSGATFGCPDAVRIAVPGPPGLERLRAALVRETARE
jgi:histidinol-phosphate/aromatic aminotransferase/cobyric acid decarboxylase-like protein